MSPRRLVRRAFGVTIVFLQDFKVLKCFREYRDNTFYTV